VAEPGHTADRKKRAPAEPRVEFANFSPRLMACKTEGRDLNMIRGVKDWQKWLTDLLSVRRK